MSGPPHQMRALLCELQLPSHIVIAKSEQYPDEIYPCVENLFVKESRSARTLTEWELCGG
jgi:hypothetical protein